MSQERPRRVLILGAAGRDFHNFNSVYRNNPRYRVVAFTATQIPDIAGRVYPPSLAGPLYPEGIPIYDEAEMTRLIRELEVDEVVFAYSDVSHEYVMDRASRALAAGADFTLLGPRSTMLDAAVPVVSVCAVRTGCGKSQTTRYIHKVLRSLGKRVAVVRHPMPYGDLSAQAVQRFATLEDVAGSRCTIEEREEYEPHIRAGAIVFAGVDYHAILAKAEGEADCILWDGGNNDLPFYRPDLHVVVADPLRPGHERTYHPGETNLLMADVVVINKVDAADPKDLEKLRASIAELNPRAQIVEARSEVTIERPVELKGKRVLAVDDGPTLTHGGMAFGAASLFAKKAQAELVDPRPYAVGTIRETFEKYPHIGPVLPAVGYSPRQIKDLEETVERCAPDLVLSGTPADLSLLIKVSCPIVRVYYELVPVSGPSLDGLVKRMLENWRPRRARSAGA